MWLASKFTINELEASEFVTLLSAADLLICMYMKHSTIKHVLDRWQVMTIMIKFLKEYVYTCFSDANVCTLGFISIQMLIQIRLFL